MVMFRRINRGRYLLLSLAGASLFMSANCLGSSAQEYAYPVVVYPASQIDCSNPPPNNSQIRSVVRSSSGLRTVAQYCTVQGPLQDQQRRDSILWSPSYRLGEFVCRDRLNVDVVCMTPAAAARLRWEIPPQ
jgi:hypothetical protein